MEKDLMVLMALLVIMLVTLVLMVLVHFMVEVVLVIARMGVQFVLLLLEQDGNFQAVV